MVNQGNISTLLNILRISKLHTADGPNESTTPITAMGCRQCLSLSVVQLKGKHCRKPHCCNGVVDTFGHWSFDTEFDHVSVVWFNFCQKT